MKVEDEVLNLMVRYSSGLPTLMHEIGDATFWTDDDGTIGMRDAMGGVFAAAEKVGQKYIDARVYRTIRSRRYLSILRKISDRPLAQSFNKKNVEERLSEDEKRVFHNFLRRMRELGVIETDTEQGPGAYRFVNAIYPVYFWMETVKAKRFPT